MNTVNQSQFNEVWRYHEDTSQELALSMMANDILYCGTRGPGKTDTQLMRFAYNVGKGYGAYWRGIIFDREYKMLDDLVTKSKRWFYPLDDGARWLSSNSDYKWVWPTGEELLFRQAKTPDDYWQYHGHEYPFIGWNELTKYSNPDLYEKMLSINRSGFIPEDNTPKGDEGQYLTPDGLPLPPIPLMVFSTCNPLGAGHNWVKRRFIDPAPYGTVIEKTITIYSAREKKDVDITRSQVTLFGNWRENPNLSPEYIAGLYASSNENEKKAWLEGRWDIVAGGAFDDVWNEKYHVIPRFKVPRGWMVDRSFDWGSSHPYSAGWWAEANGEEATLADGTKFCPAPGTLIQIAEDYGTADIGSNKGLKLGAKAVAKRLVAVEKELKAGGWIVGSVYPGPADNQIMEVREATTDTIEKMMEDEGITWERSDKAPGSRKIGLQLMRDRLENMRTREGPGLLFMDNCRASIATIPILPRDDLKIDDVDTSAEDHPYDMARYRVLKGNNRFATVIKVNFGR